nr:hypothetical protein CFP56_21148 [Quercus suber]
MGDCGRGSRERRGREEVWKCGSKERFDGSHVTTRRAEMDAIISIQTESFEVISLGTDVTGAAAGRASSDHARANSRPCSQIWRSNVVAMGCCRGQSP